mgnify:CR=1 FL=1
MLIEFTEKACQVLFVLFLDFNCLHGLIEKLPQKEISR